MTQLHLIRHGKYTSSDSEDRLVDHGLTEEGRDQARRLAAHLEKTGRIKADVLISSTMPRARQTAEILAPAFGLEVLYEERIEEWRSITEGQLTGEEFMAILQTYPPDQTVFRPIMEQGETWVEFMLRASTALNAITQEYAGKRIVLVCHGGIIEASFLFFSGASILRPPPIVIDPDYTSLTGWELFKGRTSERWKLLRFNDTAHLEEWGRHE
jgi:probable phosphoglycerate mutase